MKLYECYGYWRPIGWGESGFVIFPEHWTWGTWTVAEHISDRTMRVVYLTTDLTRRPLEVQGWLGIYALHIRSQV